MVDASQEEKYALKESWSVSQVFAVSQACSVITSFWKKM